MNKLLRYEFCGIPVIGTSLGSFALLSTMFMWYGSFFVDQFHPLMGIVEEQVTTEALGIWYPMGFVFALVQGTGIALLLKWRNWPSIRIAAQTGLAVAVLLGSMVFSYRLAILPEHSVQLFLINASGLIVAWTLASVIISILAPRRVEING